MSRDTVHREQSPVCWLVASGGVLGLLGGLGFGLSLFFPEARVCLESGCQTLTGAQYWFSVDGNGPLKALLLALTSLLSVPAFLLVSTRLGWVVWGQAIAAVVLLLVMVLGQFMTLGGGLVLVGSALLVCARLWFRRQVRHASGVPDGQDA